MPGNADTELNMQLITALKSIVVEQENIGNAIKSLADFIIELHNQTKQTREAIQTLSASQPVRCSKIRCIFLVHSIETWDAHYDVYQAMLNDNRFEPFVVSINRRFGNSQDYIGEQRVSDELDLLTINHIRIDMQDSFVGLNLVRGLMPDIIFRQSQWDNLYPPAFSSNYLNFAKLCVIPYGTSIVATFENESPEKEFSEFSYDTPYHQAAWRIYCETQLTYDYIKSFRHASDEKLVLSGYPKLDRLLSERPEWPIKRQAPTAAQPYRIIWAPHHTAQDQWLNFGVFHRVYKDFLMFAKERQDIDFVLKPHPELFGSVINRGVMTQNEVNNFLTEWLMLPNCAYENNRYGALFAASDLMVTDGISFIVEYPIFEKPLVFFDSGVHAPLNEIGQLGLNCADIVFDFTHLKKVLNNHIQGRSIDYKLAQKKLINILFPRKGKTTDIILNNIADSIKYERK